MPMPGTLPSPGSWQVAFLPWPSTGCHRERAEPANLQRQAFDLRSQLAADFPTEPVYRWALASSYNDLASMLHGGGERAEAERLYRRALDLQAKLVVEFPSMPNYRR